MKKHISANLIGVITHLFDSATSAVRFNGGIWDWFRTTVRVRQRCVLTHLLQRISRRDHDTLEDHKSTFSIGGRTVINLCFAGNIDGLAGEEEELAKLVERLDKAATAYSMEVSA